MKEDKSSYEQLEQLKSYLNILGKSMCYIENGKVETVDIIDLPEVVKEKGIKKLYVDRKSAEEDLKN